MSTERHTPGPWFTERMYEASRTIAIMRDFKGLGMALAVHGPQDWIHAAGAADQIEANAHLIAAAPDLLAALKEATDLLDGDGYSTWEMHAAIAKAEGQ